MFSTVLGILCGAFIAGDYFGFRTLDGFWYFAAWVGVLADAYCQDVRVSYRDKSPPSTTA